MSKHLSNALRRVLSTRIGRDSKTTKPNYRKRLQILTLEDRVTPATLLCRHGCGQWPRQLAASDLGCERECWGGLD